MEYQLIKEDRYQEVLKHLKEHFFADEPLNKATDLCEHVKGQQYMEQQTIKTLCDGLSIMALDSNNQIAGVCLNGVLRKGDIEKGLYDLAQYNDESFQSIYRFLYTLNLRQDLFTTYKVEKVFDVRILSVDSGFRGQGIAKKLITQSEKVARDNDFKIMKADATGIFSQKIFRSQGYVILQELYYDKYTNENGEPILKVSSPHLKAELLCKYLKDT